MALTPEQEAYLAKVADRSLAEQAYAAKVAELQAARAAVNDTIFLKYKDAIEKNSGDAQKQAIKALQAEIAAEPTVAAAKAAVDALGFSP